MSSAIKQFFQRPKSFFLDPKKFFNDPSLATLTVCILVAIAIMLGVIIAAATGAFVSSTPAATGAFVSSTPASTIGNVAKARTGIDVFSGQVMIQNATLATKVGKQIISWSFYNETNTNYVTPVLVEKNIAGNYVVRGIGKTIQSTKAKAVQSQSFGLVTGTDTIDSAAFYLGHYHGSWNGTLAVGNQGAVEWDSTKDAAGSVDIASTSTIRLAGTTASTDDDSEIALNKVLYKTGDIDSRVYSINFSVAE